MKDKPTISAGTTPPSVDTIKSLAAHDDTTEALTPARWEQMAQLIELQDLTVGSENTRIV